MKKLVVLMLLLAIGGGGGAYYWRSKHEAGPRLRTAPVQRGELVITIPATGTVEPVEVVDVGAQIAGKIESFGTDPHTGQRIDYGSQVEENTILAQIDKTLYAADVQTQQAQIDQAIANRDRAKAELEQSKAQFRQAERDWKRAEGIMATNASALAATDFDGYRAKFEMAQATILVSQASIEQAEKAVALAKATLTRAQTNLGYCTIKSPVKGVVIARRVNVGQTVVASLNAPSLFLIAKDLRNMQVWVAVNEADIGRIHRNQPVTFTVDAFPGLQFRGTVNKIRLDASMTQNVVTYTVEVNTDNSNLKLLPYMSATVRFETARQTDVLTVPNSALNWTPGSDLIAPDAREAYEQAAAKRGDDRDRPARPARRNDASQADSRPAATASAPAKVQSATVWVLDGEYVRPITVTVGGSDGSDTEVTSPDLKEGTEVVVGQETVKAGDSGGTNPFAPKFPGRGARRM